MNKQKDMRKLKKRSIKNRTRKLMNLSTTVSTLFMCVVMFFIVTFAISLLATIYLRYSANELANILRIELENNGYSTVSEYLEKINPKKMNMEIEFTVENEMNAHADFFDQNPIDYQFLVNDEILYSSMGTFKSLPLNAEESQGFLESIFSHIETTNVISDEGVLLGTVMVTPNPILLSLIYFLVIFLGIGLLIANSIVTKIITSILSRQVVKPLDVLNQSLLALSSTESARDQMIQPELIVKKPLYEVNLLITATNKIIAKFNDINQIMNAQNEELEAQNLNLAETKDAIASMNTAYMNRSINLQSLLNNIGQGFMTINHQLKINPEYSYECERMIQCSGTSGLSGLSIMETLFNGYHQSSFVLELFGKIFACESSQWELFLSLLPEEIEIQERILKITYKIVQGDVQDTQLLIILTDITHTRNLENQMLEERNHLNMIVKVLLSRFDCIHLIQDYTNFCCQEFSTLSPEDYSEILREIHTFKGVFSQYYMNNITEYLNNLENVFNHSQDLSPLNSLNYLELFKALEIDIEIIKSYIGKDFLEVDETYTIKENKIVEIEHKLKRLLPSTEYNKVLPLIRSLRNKSLKELLGGYCDYTQKLSERLNKNVHPFEIEGDEIYIDPQPYQDLIKNIVHLFRNSVDHGIEDSDTRIELGKEEVSHITCTIKNFPSGFEIIVSDDGQGMDAEQLVLIAQQKGLLTQAQITEMSQEDLLGIIFMDGFTTKENATSISGRGIGLSSLGSSINELGGSIHIESTLKVGTTFTLSIPYISSMLMDSYSSNNFLKNMVVIARNLYDTIGIHTEHFDLLKTNRISLHKISSLVSIKGSIDAILIISIDESLGRKMVKSFMLEDIEDDLLGQYIEDVLSEVTNTVLGNSLGSFEADGMYLSIGVPATIVNTNAYVKYSESHIFTINYDQVPYAISMNFILIDSEFGNQIKFIDENFLTYQEDKNG